MLSPTSSTPPPIAATLFAGWTRARRAGRAPGRRTRIDEPRKEVGVLEGGDHPGHIADELGGSRDHRRHDQPDDGDGYRGRTRSGRSIPTPAACRALQAPHEWAEAEAANIANAM